MKNITTIFIAILVQTWPMHAQDWQWAGAFNGSDINNHGGQIFIDAKGNKYVTGVFGSSMDFDPGPAVYNLTSISSAYQGFLVKLDSADNFIWAKTLESATSNGFTHIAGIVADPVNGHELYLAGHYKDDCDLDPGPGISYHAGNGLYDTYIIKLDSAGNFIWGKSIGGQYADIPYGLTLDYSGTPAVYVTGGFGSTVDFDPGPGVFNLNSPGFDDDAFLLKLDTAGNFQWVNQIEGRATGHSVAVDTAGTGNVYLSGWFLGNNDFITGASSLYLNSVAGSSDAFAAKYNSSGNLIWAKAMGGSMTDWARQIKIDADGSGNFCVAGHFSTTADFDPGLGVFNLTSQGNTDMFAARFDSSGSLLWAGSMGGTGSDYINGLATKPSGDNSIYVTGEFANTADFDPGPGTYMMTSDGSSDSFVCKLDSSGNFVWAVKSTGGTSMDKATQIFVAPTGIYPLYIVGEYKTTSLSFGNNLLPAPGGNNVHIFLAKLQDTTNTSTGITQDFAAGNDIYLYPNPATTEVSIQSINFMIQRFEIFDLHGRLQALNLKPQNNSIDISGLNDGLYFLKATTPNGVIVMKFIKQ